MSKGWESKSVEQQQAEAMVPKQAKPSAHAGDAEKTRRRQALEMQREHILSQRTSSPHRRSALELALADIEEQLAELGWSIHL